MATEGGGSSLMLTIWPFIGIQAPILSEFHLQIKEKHTNLAQEVRKSIVKHQTLQTYW